MVGKKKKVICTFKMSLNFAVKIGFKIEKGSVFFLIFFFVYLAVVKHQILIKGAKKMSMQM